MHYVYLLVEQDPTYQTHFNMGCYETFELAEQARADRQNELLERFQALDRGVYYIIETLPLHKDPA